VIGAAAPEELGLVISGLLVARRAWRFFTFTDTPPDPNDPLVPLSPATTPALLAAAPGLAYSRGVQHRILVRLALAGTAALLATAGCDPAATPEAAAPVAAPATPAAPKAGAYNVLVVVMDTLRADALGAYGQQRPTSPVFDTFASEGVLFETAWTQYTWTLPSFVSYMTSSWARSHGWDYSMGKLDTYKVLDSKTPTMADVFTKAGYATSGHFANMHLKAELGFGRGFETWQLGTEAATVRAAVADIGKWKDDGKPNFLYVHLMAPHVALLPTPESQAAIGVSVAYEPKKGISYDHYVAAPPELKEQRRQELVDAYHACVRDGDNDLAEILSALKASGAAEETVVGFWSDHGEMLGEHTHIGHNQYVWQEVVKVPLVIKAPGLAPRRESQRVGRLIDAAPTLVKLAGLTPPPEWQGQSLFEGEQPIVAAERDALVTFLQNGWKSVEDRTKDKFMYAHDLTTDPQELTQVKDVANPGVAPLILTAQAWRAQVPQGENTGGDLTLDAAAHAETVQQLEALGYTDKPDAAPK
jgi:arylsulfatase A-like enzyme